MGILNEKELDARYEAIRKKIGDKYGVYFNKPNGVLKACVPNNKDLTIVELEEILEVGLEMAKLESLKRIHAELVRGGVEK